MGPVFLFDVGVVVFVIGSASGELDGLFSISEVPEEVIVKELAAVIAIKAADGEREVFFDVLDLFQDARLALSPYCPLFCPAGSDIDEVNGVGVHSLRGIATMSDGIGFEEARARFVPLIGFDG